LTVPGIHTQKIRKLTGEHGFTQTFFEDACVPADGLMGAEGMGWKIAMQTLEYERGARGGQAGGYSMTEPDPLEILSLARETGQLEDPIVQDDLIDFIIEAQALNLNGQRAKVGALIRDNPAGLPLMNKLAKTEFAREINQYALTLQGTRSAYYVDEPNAIDGGWWHRSYLNAFSATIGGGTSQIQRNIIGEHVLGLPKSLDISEEQVEFMDMAERFCRDTASIAALRDMVAAGEGLDVSAADAMSAMGWFGITIPEDYGGVGLTLAEAVPVAEQIGRRLMMVPFIPVTVAAQAILAGGTGAQKNQYLPKIVDEGGAALALSEVNGSFDLADIAATASLGKQGYKLSGTKILVECLDSAEFLVLSALVDGAVRLFERCRRWSGAFIRF